MRFGMTIALAGIALILGASTGCSTAAKQSVYTVIGAQGSFYELQAVDPDTLATYQRVSTRSFGSDLDGTVPAPVLQEIDAKMPVELTEAKLFFPEGKELVVQGRVIHYTGRSGVKGAIKSIVGDEQCVCRVTLHDGESGAVIGEAVCWGSVKSALRRGASEFGSGVGRGVAKWIEKRLPEAERERRKEALSEK